MVKKILINRGIPGSGKSESVFQYTRRNDIDISDTLVCSTDHYSECHGVYVFDIERLGLFHRLNKEDVERACQREIHYIFVDNTNITWKEIKPYVEIGLEYGYSIEILEPETEWRYDVDACFKRNQHEVPLETIQKMREKWVDSSEIRNKIKDLKEKEDES